MALFKDPAAELDYGWDWERWLKGDTIASSSWVLDTDDATFDDATFDDTSTTVRISGGVAGTTVSATNHIVTEAGLINERTIRIGITDL